MFSLFTRGEPKPGLFTRLHSHLVLFLTFIELFFCRTIYRTILLLYLILKSNCPTQKRQSSTYTHTFNVILYFICIINIFNIFQFFDYMYIHGGWVTEVNPR